MKKKCLSLLMAVCVFSAFPGALSCQCVDANCGSVPKTIREDVPQCHHTSAPSKEKNDPAQECCGKCQIEKAAVLSAEFSTAGDVRPRNTLVGIRSFADFYAKLLTPSFFQGECPEAPPGFFEHHVLNTTFSFRAPPQGQPL